MSPMTVTDHNDQDPSIPTCGYCRHQNTHIAPTIPRLGGGKYCSNCPECQTELDQMLAPTASTAPRPLGVGGD